MTRSLKSQTRTMQTITRTYWRVRMINKEGFLAPHHGWVVVFERGVKRGPALDRMPEKIEKEWKEAVKRVKDLGIDNGPDGEYAEWPEFTVDIVEWNNGIAEL